MTLAAAPVSCDVIEPLLAGTQCTQCGYPNCAAYAAAVVAGAAHNLCRPGGARVTAALAQALGREDILPAVPPVAPRVVRVVEADCIGCTLCLQACPTGAIVGANKMLHSVLTSDCTGCGLCVPVCPAECIETVPAPAEHTLTAVLPDGSLTLAASRATWALVQAHAARAPAAGAPRARRAVAASTSSLAVDLPAELQAKLAAARAKAQEKYSAAGKTTMPKVLAGVGYYVPARRNRRAKGPAA